MAHPPRTPLVAQQEQRTVIPAQTVFIPADEPEQTAESAAGPRKLVRPKLPAQSSRRSVSSRGESVMLTHQAAQYSGASAQAHESEDAHAEAFYFQKQMQTQTLMVFVLEDGEEIEGYIEWFDRYAIKVRNGRKTLIYKSAIKYLYKAGEEHAR